METSKELYSQMLELGADWKVDRVDLNTEEKSVEIKLIHNGSKCFCGECESHEKVYDYSPERKWRHLDTMQFSTVIIAKTPRVDCKKCGKVKSAFLPWAGKHSRFTLFFEAFAIQVIQSAKSMKAAKELLRLTWEQTHQIMERAVNRGLKRRGEEEITDIGMDEKSFRKGHDYISVLNDLEEGRVIDVEEGRSGDVAETLLNKGLSEWQQEMVRGVSIDMSAPYIKAINKLLPQASIVHDKFHISQHINNAVDLTRRADNRALVKAGDKSLVGTKYTWLKNHAKLSEEEIESIKLMESQGLEVTKAWYLKELFTNFWKQTDPESALQFFAYWAYEVIQSGNQPMRKVMKTLWKHMSNILTYFDSFITNAVSEGLNSKIQALKANARGFKSFDNYRITILFHCGKLRMAP